MRLPTLTGEFRTTADPELRFTPSGKAVANLTVICTESKRTQDGQGWEDGDSTPFIAVSVWGQQAEDVAETITKGERVLVTGQLYVRKYQRQDGSEGQSVELKYATVAPVPGGKPRGERPAGNGNGYAYGQQQQRPPQDPWAQQQGQQQAPPQQGWGGQPQPQPQGQPQQQDPWATPGGQPPF